MAEVPRDHAQFEAFYRAHRPLVFAVAMRLVRDPLDAEDVTQRVFLKAWARPGAFHGGNVESWLTTVTKNACIDDLRIASRESLQSSVPDRRSPACARSAEDEALALVMYASIERAVERLDCRTRAAVVAAFVDLQTHQVIADAAQLPLGTVKTRIRSGLTQLRRMLRDAS